MVSVRSDQWEAAVVLVEQCYHFSMASLRAYAIVLDTYYAMKPRNHSSTLVTSLVIFFFHTAFLGHSGANGLMPSKLICLLDMLLHLADMASDVLLVVALLRCSKNSFAMEVLESTTCQTVSLVGAIISILYQVAILATYYCRVKVSPAEKPPCYASVAVSWLRKHMYETLCQAEAPPDSQMLGDTFEVERTLHTDGICHASFEVSHHPSGIVVTRRHTALAIASAELHEDDSDA